MHVSYVDRNVVRREIMGESRPEPTLARFGVFEFRLDTGELRKCGVNVECSAGPFFCCKRCLNVTAKSSLGRNCGRGFGRRRLCVDFESGLNTAVNRLRAALGDSAEAPLYIETMARLGYRFVAPVDVFRWS